VSEKAAFAKHVREMLIREECATARSILTGNLEELTLFSDSLEDFIAKEEKRAVKALLPHAEEDGDFWANHYPYHWQDIIGAQLRQSFVVSLMSATEFHLDWLCRDTAQVVQAAITHEELKGTALERARRFLNAFAQFTAPPDALWEEIGDLQALRNNIVHNAALVDAEHSNKRRLAGVMKRRPGISNPSTGLLKLERAFSEYALATVQRFFDELYAQQKALCKRAASTIGQGHG